MTETTVKLPDVATIGPGAPLDWLKRGWRDFTRAPAPFMVFGIGLAFLSAMIAWGLMFSGAFAWVFVLAGGFFFIAPMLAMGLYRGGEMLERGEQPGLKDLLLVKGAFRRDLAYLGLALLLIYMLWTRIAQVVYALSTTSIHKTPMDFLRFMFTETNGQTMAMIGTIVGGIIAFLAYSLVVISAPMLLNRKTDVFIATITSVRAVNRNLLPMLIWAVLIAVLTTIGIATAFFGLIFVFPVIGLASWHAYRDLVPASPKASVDTAD